MPRTAMSGLGQKAKYSLRANIVRFAPESGLKSDIAGGPFRANSGNSGNAPRSLIDGSGDRMDRLYEADGENSFGHPSQAITFEQSSNVALATPWDVFSFIQQQFIVNFSQSPDQVASFFYASCKRISNASRSKG